MSRLVYAEVIQNSSSLRQEIAMYFYKTSDSTAIHYLYSTPCGYRSRHRVTQEIMLSLLYLCLGSRVWLQYYCTELCSEGTVPKRLISPGHRELVVLEEES